MTINLVVDASVAMKWVLKEEYAEQALMLVDDRKSYNFSAPDLIETETANALWKHVKAGEMTVEIAKNLHEIIFAENIISLHPARPLIPRALEIADAIKHNTVYDCLYMALAETLNCDVITADKEFIKRAEKAMLPSRIRFIANLQ